MNNEKSQADYPSSHYLSNLNNPHATNQTIHLNRLPTLGEILANKTKSPVDLRTFYRYMDEIEGKLDHLDFWFELINHLNLCKHYVKGLRDSIVRQSYNHYTSGGVGSVTGTGTNAGVTSSSSGAPGSPTDPFQSPGDGKHKSLSSSILLDLILNDHILEDSDSNRLSQFLRGDIQLENADPKLRDMILRYNDSNNRSSNGSSVLATPTQTSFVFSKPPTPNIQGASANRRYSSHSKLVDEQSLGESMEIGQADRAVNPNMIPLRKETSINPALLERLVHRPQSESNSFITRNNLKESSHNLLLKYFVEDSEKNLYLPERMNRDIIKAIEVEGRDDPDIFHDVRIFVFSRLENDYLPRFLNFVAIRNVNHTGFMRIFLGFFFIFVAFWVGFIFIFLNTRKSLRPVVLVPYGIGFYFLITSVYLVDPLLILLGYGESFTRENTFLVVRDKFVRNLLLRRSIWVAFLVVLCTAALTILFVFVPGHRL